MATPLLGAGDVALLRSDLADPALIGPLLAILQNPVSTERPDLLHFETSAPSLQRQVGAIRRLDPERAAGAVLAAAGLLLAALSLVRLGGYRRIALLLLAAAVGGGAGIATGAPLLAAGPTSTIRPAPLPDRVAARPPVRRAPAAPADWASLLVIETRLAAQQRVLVSDETQIADLTRALTEGDPADLTPAKERRVSARLQLLVARHDALAPSYNATLQDEYLIYRSAAQVPAQAVDLRGQARAAGPRSAAAVQGDLDIVSTQLQQEAAIAAAEARLRQLGYGVAQSSPLQSQDAFQAPATGAIGQPFGPTAFPLEPPLEYNGVFYPHFHTGIDIDAALDTPVQAAMAGVVALVASSTDGHGHSTGYGNYVVIQHGHGYATLYAHLDRAMVAAGQLVSAGQVIGLVGSSGNSTGPHLHFEVRRDGGFLDPLPYVTGAVRPW